MNYSFANPYQAINRAKRKKVRRPITIFFEISGPFQIRPGYHRGSFAFGQSYFKRIWWLWFAIAWVRMDLKSYRDYIASGLSEWEPREPREPEHDGVNCGCKSFDDCPGR